jgi:hypothetical protein
MCTVFKSISQIKHAFLAHITMKKQNNKLISFLNNYQDFVPFYLKISNRHFFRKILDKYDIRITE